MFMPLRSAQIMLLGGIVGRVRQLIRVLDILGYATPNFLYGFLFLVLLNCSTRFNFFTWESSYLAHIMYVFVHFIGHGIFYTTSRIFLLPQDMKGGIEMAGFFVSISSSLRVVIEVGVMVVTIWGFSQYEKTFLDPESSFIPVFQKINFLLGLTAFCAVVFI